MCNKWGLVFLCGTNPKWSKDTREVKMPSILLCILLGVPTFMNSDSHLIVMP